jgi:hypothetical protein
MKTEEKVLWGVCGVALLAVAAVGLHAQAVQGQAVGAADPAPRVLALLADQNPAAGELVGEGQLVHEGDIVREIDDPNTGARWLLLRDRSHPGGPGRLVLANESGNGGEPREPGAAPNLAVATPAVRSGDRLVVEESTAMVEARLDAVALGPAAIGSTVQARLAIGGKVVRAVVLAPGRAALQADTAVRP